MKKKFWHCLLAVCVISSFILQVHSPAESASERLYVKLVNATTSFAEITLYIDGKKCGVATPKKPCICPVTSGIHVFKAVGINKKGKQQTKFRKMNITKVLTWTIDEKR